MTLVHTSDHATRSRRPWWIALAFAGLVVALYLAGYFLTGSRMPAGTTIGGLEVSSMTSAAARTAIDEEFGPRLDDPVELTRDDQRFTVAAEDAGLVFDPQASVDQAGGRSWNPIRMGRLLFGSNDYPLVHQVDGSKMNSVVSNMAEALDEPEVEPQITFEDEEPVVRDPKDGRRVDAAETVETIKAAYLVTTEPQGVPMRTTKPTVDNDGVKYAVDTFARPAMSEPVVLQVGNKRVDLPPTAYESSLSVEVQDEKMVPRIDADKLTDPLADSTADVGKKAEDAVISIEGGEPVIEESITGLGLQPKKLAERLVPVLTETGDERTLEVDAEVVEPDFTTEDAEALDVDEKVSSFSTDYPPANYRDVNQGRAAELIDGTLLEPGETFSFNDTVGERTKSNGFTEGSIISDGALREELGGGVSQVVTTVYNAAFFAGLQDIEHKPHSFYIDRYPVGREATVAWPSLDMRFKNDTDHGVLVSADVTESAGRSKGTMTVEMWSTKEWDVEASNSERRNEKKGVKRYDDSDECVEQSPVTGFDIDVTRIWNKDGERVKSETKTARYNAADEIICGEDPDD